MRAWQVRSYSDKIVLVNLARPAPGPAEVLLKVSAAGLNFADLLMAEGRYQTRPNLPFIPGMEVSGTVVALGPETKGPAVGSRVAAIVGNGALAEFICAPVQSLFSLPDAMPMNEAAGFQISYATSHLALTRRARMQPGETLFVTGAAGGVGLTAVELGKRLGARVIASARGAAKLAVARDAGADVLIDSDAPGLKEALRKEGSVDVVYDTVGGPAFDEAARATRTDGRLLIIGFASGVVPQIPANLLLVKNISVHGFWLGGYQQLVPDLVRASLDTLSSWYAEGSLRPHVSHVLPFEQLPEALDLLRNRTATGKVVISLDQANAQ